MKTKGCWILIGCCLLALTCPAEEPIVAFAKQSLGIDLATIPFGQSVQTDNSYQASSAPLATQFNLCDDPSITWVTNSFSGKYHQEHVNRILRYAVKNGKIVGIRVSLESMARDGRMLSQDEFARNREELRHVYDERTKMRKLQKESGKPASFELRTGEMCGGRESLFLYELQFTPAGTFLGSGKLNMGTTVQPAVAPASKDPAKQ